MSEAFFSQRKAETQRVVEPRRSTLPSKHQLTTAALFALFSTVLVIGSGTTSPRIANALDEPLRTAKSQDLGSQDLGLPAKESKILEKPSRLGGGLPTETVIGGSYPTEGLEQVELRRNKAGDLVVNQLPSFSSRLGDRVVSTTNRKDYVFYTLQGALQDHAEKLIEKATVPHAALVVMNPRTGAILAMAGKSPLSANPQLMSTFPAASLFKVVTSAAAIESADLRPDTEVRFRGGDYTLNLWNYIPDARRDTRHMSMAEALARSCNPVFGQIGGRYVGSKNLAQYSKLFGFNTALGFDAPLSQSVARMPDGTDLYDLTRTAAGFGDVSISPVHAAAIMSAIANGGLLPKPRIIDRVVTEDGVVLHRSSPTAVQRVIRNTTAKTILSMMELTTTMGTSRKEFTRGGTPMLPGLNVAAKTGTLKGTNPEGLTNWFIAAAPAENPTVALAVVVVDPSHSMRASYLGRKMFEKFFNITPAFGDPVAMKQMPRKVSKVTRSKYTKLKKKIVKKKTKKRR